MLAEAVAAISSAERNADVLRHQRKQPIEVTRLDDSFKLLADAGETGIFKALLGGWQANRGDRRKEKCR
jgi:hypothetical protein